MIPGSGSSPGEGIVFLGFLGGSDGKAPAMLETWVRFLGWEDPLEECSIPGLGRSPGGVHGNPFQYSCLENPHRQRSWQAAVQWGRKESDTAEVP